jgi:hypothetical protein
MGSSPFGADDGIRTRDPHLGKVAELVFPVLDGLAQCGFVYPVSTYSSE